MNSSYILYSHPVVNGLYILLILTERLSEHTKSSVFAKKLFRGKTANENTK